jgi:hypothetical protein
LGLAVDAHVGDGVEPDLGGRLDRAEFAQLEPPQEVLFDVANPRLDPSLLVAAANIAGDNLKAVVAGKVQIARIEHRRDAGQTLQDCRFEIVDHEFGGNASSAKACSWQARKCSMVCDTVNSTKRRRL